MSGKKGGSAARARQAKLAEVQRQQRRKEMLRTGGIVAGVVVVIAAVAVTVAVAQGKSKDTDEHAANGSSAKDLTGVKTYEGLSATHKTGPLPYDQSPPVGGDHNPIWLNCGVYSSPVPNENAVHAMEHGAVWVTYRPDLPASEVQKLEGAMPGSYIVLSPYPDLQAPVIASAWGKQLLLDGADDPRLSQFLSTFVQGPQTPELGATCAGGSDGTLPLDDAGGM